ncbi:hypothetical protein TARUN_6471 [Trichoderma arundinaceum]|uniref:Uncharacterized protein n=1 Tax=Trichoderma arundinaceum TaxID=490622 RepID=A0A395NHZ3_TRIAR|nr:hypothetical protein TARUN_6471 [Trichoderma arundinaceum]
MHASWIGKAKDGICPDGVSSPIPYFPTTQDAETSEKSKILTAPLTGGMMMMVAHCGARSAPTSRNLPLEPPPAQLIRPVFGADGSTAFQGTPGQIHTTPRVPSSTVPERRQHASNGIASPRAARLRGGSARFACWKSAGLQGTQPAVEPSSPTKPATGWSDGTPHLAQPPKKRRNPRLTAQHRCHWPSARAYSDDAAGRARKATVAGPDARCLDADFPWSTNTLPRSFARRGTREADEPRWPLPPRERPCQRLSLLCAPCLGSAGGCFVLLPPSLVLSWCLCRCCCCCCCCCWPIDSPF